MAVASVVSYAIEAIRDREAASDNLKPAKCCPEPLCLITSHHLLFLSYADDPVNRPMSDLANLVFMLGAVISQGKKLGLGTSVLQPHQPPTLDGPI
ncbi:hypothetical protein SRHO_G00107730 [Serrasalmus rhombeus]